MKLARASFGQSATSPWRANVALTDLLHADGVMTTRVCRCDDNPWRLRRAQSELKYTLDLNRRIRHLADIETKKASDPHRELPSLTVVNYPQLYRRELHPPFTRTSLRPSRWSAAVSKLALRQRNKVCNSLLQMPWRWSWPRARPRV